MPDVVWTTTDGKLRTKFLTEGQLAIWEHRSGKPRWKEDQYIARWMGEPKPKDASGRPAAAVPPLECPHRGESTGKLVPCRTCAAQKEEVFTCSLHGECTQVKPARNDTMKCCKYCHDLPANVEQRAKNAERLQLNLATWQKPSSSLPVQMVMPGDKRPHVYRGGILQIWLTNACDRSCYACTQGSNLAGKPKFITLDQFRVAVASLKDYFGVVGIFGGNPTLHPQFEEICRDLREVIPWEQRGLWSNHPKGKGRIAAITFNPAFSNLNVHESQEAYDEFARDWPECKPYLKGLDSDSRHSPPFVAMKDVVSDEAERWRLIQSCDINRSWSAMIAVFRGQLRGYFCEIAASQAMLHQDEPDYPDTGVPIAPGWWKQGQEAFEGQIRKHCIECGVPLRGHGMLANDESQAEQVSETHAAVYRPKRLGRKVEIVTDLIQLGSPLKRSTDYIENGGI